jgi:putative MATE family efflux protein
MQEEQQQTEQIENVENSANQEQVNRLGTAKISKLMVEFAIPAIVGVVVNGLYNIIDSSFLGHGVGPDGLAAIQVATPIMIFSMAMGVLIGAGGNALMALRLGERKHKAAEKVMGNAFTLTIISALICTALVLLFMEPVLQLSGAAKVSATVKGYSEGFIHIIAVFFVLQFFGMGFNNFIRTAGDPNRALYTMIIGTVVCIILNYLFVMVFNWGVNGSAWATVIGQGVSAVLVFWYFVFSKKAPFKLRWSNLMIKPRIVGAICALGSATFFMQMANVVINVILNSQLNTYGALDPIGADGALASIGLIGRITMFAFFPVLGVAMAAQPLFGYNYGAGKFDRVKSTFKVALIWTTAIGIFFWVLVHTIPVPIVNLFGVPDDLRDFTVIALQVQMFLMPLIGMQVLGSNYFQSSGQPLRSMFLSLTRQVLYLIPLIYFMPQVVGHILPNVTPLQALVASYPVADVLSVLTAGIMMFLELRKLNRRIAEQKNADKNEPALA